MSITKTSSWSHWSADVNESISFQNTLTQQAAYSVNQINTLIQGWKNGNISLSQFQSSLSTLNASMTTLLNSLPNQFPNLKTNPECIQAINNLKTAWQTTLATFNPSISNPNVNNDPDQPTLPVTYNEDGTVTIRFTCPYTFDGYPHLLSINCLNEYDGGPWWMPAGKDTDSDGNLFQEAALNITGYSGISSFTWNNVPGNEEISLVRGPNNMVTVTITTVESNIQNDISAVHPDSTALSNFVSNPFGN